MRNILMCALLLGASLATASHVNAEGDGNQCNNYGFRQQVAVVGNNEGDTCQAQHCQQGPAGAGAAGVGVGTANGEGEAGASASAGTSCTQSNGNNLQQQGQRPDPAVIADGPWRAG